MIKKYNVGYVYPKSDTCRADKVLVKLLKQKFNLLLFPIEEQIEVKPIEERAKLCKLILNDAVYEPYTWEAMELSKTFEEFGIKVVNSSHSFYYQEDKWMFYLECLEHGIPTPLTYLVPKELNYKRDEIKQILGEHEIVIKAVFSDQGLCVERAKTLEEFDHKIKKIIKKNPTSPVIAQEYLDNGGISYRVMLIGHKVVQGVIKKGKSWEQTGAKTKEICRTFRPDKKLRKLCEKTSKAFGMDLCGLDLIKHNDNWYIIEANGCPALDFVISDIKRITNILVNYLYQKVKRLSK